MIHVGGGIKIVQTVCLHQCATKLSILTLMLDVVALYRGLLGLSAKLICNLGLLDLSLFASSLFPGA